MADTNEAGRAAMLHTLRGLHDHMIKVLADDPGALTEAETVALLALWHRMADVLGGDPPGTSEARIPIGASEMIARYLGRQAAE